MKQKFFVPIVFGMMISIGAASNVFAQDNNRFDVQQLAPMPGQTINYLDMSSAEVFEYGQWEAGIFFNYADDPLVLSDPNGERTASIVHSQGTANILMAYGIFPSLDIGMDLPFVFLQTGDEIPRFSEANAEDAGFSLGDLRLIPRYQVLRTNTEEDPGGVDVALYADISFPTGNSDNYQGEDFHAEPGVAVDYTLSNDIKLGINLGYLFRHNAELHNLEVIDTFSYGIAADIPIGDGTIHIVPQIDGESPFGADDAASEERPLEWALAGRYFMSESLMLQAGFGAGIISGYGTPDWRMFFSVHLSSESNPDLDLDGILNEDDACPTDPEDFDGFEDVDGCPELDNDGDGIADVHDGELLETGFGACMNDPEDFDNDRDDDGCPEDDLDTDGDGITDPNDACIDDPEDFDGFEDIEGCPEPDNDGDGVLDVNDGPVDANGFGSCLNDPEDVDGFEDEDGCPDPDNDQDGVLDANDGENGSCMNDPEDYDGYEDADGCPEEASGDIELTCAGIELTDTVYFDSNSDVIQERSYDLLNQVSTVLVSATWITRIRVEGHTDDRGSDSLNLDLSQRRAESVRAYLQSQGVSMTIDAEGFGEIRPIEDNNSRSGRAANRRVEFHIVEQDNSCE